MKINQFSKNETTNLFAIQTKLKIYIKYVSNARIKASM